MARPSEFTEEMADRICELVADGEYLTAVCKREDMPALSTVLRWRADRPEFDRLIELAQEQMGLGLLKEAREIADDCSGDTAGAGGEDGARRGAYAAIARAKLRIDVRFRMMARLTARRCGAGGRRGCPSAEPEPFWDGPIEVEYAE